MIPVSVENVNLSAVGASAVILLVLMLSLMILSFVEIAVIRSITIKHERKIKELEEK